MVFVHRLAFHSATISKWDPIYFGPYRCVSEINEYNQISINIPLRRSLRNQKFLCKWLKPYQRQNDSDFSYLHRVFQDYLNCPQKRQLKARLDDIKEIIFIDIANEEIFATFHRAPPHIAGIFDVATWMECVPQAITKRLLKTFSIRTEQEPTDQLVDNRLLDLEKMSR